MTSQTAQKNISTTAYDELPYQSYTYPQTHPRHMATVGTLFGMTPPPVATARVLELGCASGGNLFSQALAYPDAHFTGLDLSQEQITLANKIKADLCIKNIDFIQQDITKFDLKKNAGKFDYIIAHGVLSWVPEKVQDKIFALCDSCLSEDGLAMISYNTLPGWNAVRSLREMMQFHTNRFSTPREKIDQSRALLNFLAENVNDSQSSYRAIIDEERKLLNTTDDSYIFHDHLEEENHQFYLHQFVGNARKYALDYVGDTAVPSMFIGNMSGNAATSLQALSDVVLQEQYMDFVTNRRFRHSILCKKGRTINRNIQSNVALNFHLTAVMNPQAQTPDADGKVQFTLANGANFTTSNLSASALYLELCASGKKPVHARDLMARSVERYKADVALTETVLLESTINLALHGFLDLHIDSPGMVQTVSDKPEISAFTRHQAAQPGCSIVTSAVHHSVTVNTATCALLQLLDGTRTLNQIMDEMTNLTMKGVLTVTHDGKTLETREDIRRQMESIVPNTLATIAAEGLLIG